MKLMLQDEKTNIFLSDFVFNQDFNDTLVHQVVTAYSAGSRQGSKSQKSKSEVSGSGKKPWRQKGTGRARVGSIRSPIWRSGGVTFAAKPRLYTQKINKKMYRAALRIIFSTLIKQNRLIILKSFYILYPKTKLLLKKLSNISLHKVLIITKYLDKNLFFASRNLYQVCIQDVQSINPIDLIKYKNIIVTLEAIKRIEEKLL